MSLFDAKEQVRQATDIVDLIGGYMELRRQGRIFVGHCPWHEDRKAESASQSRATIVEMLGL